MAVSTGRRRRSPKSVRTRHARTSSAFASAASSGWAVTPYKDEFEQMVNWKRVFEQIWQQVRWLISYGQINELALRKIMKKFVKNLNQELQVLEKK